MELHIAVVATAVFICEHGRPMMVSVGPAAVALSFCSHVMCKYMWVWEANQEPSQNHNRNASGTCAPRTCAPALRISGKGPSSRRSVREPEICADYAGRRVRPPTGDPGGPPGRTAGGNFLGYFQLKTLKK